MLEESLGEVSKPDIARFEDSTAQTLALVVRASVPLEGAEDAELVAFRPADGGQEHYAILIGSKGAASLAPPGPVLTRLHSECFTGDLLGSLKCDCGDQLRGAVKTIAKAGGGVLLYLAQEGRGIGLMNKLRAYRLQDEGFDTMEANQRLGFEADERLYDIAARMLRLLGYSKVKLMTNNPDKMRALQAAGIEVVMRVPVTVFPTMHTIAIICASKPKKAAIFCSRALTGCVNGGNWRRDHNWHHSHAEARRAYDSGDGYRHRNSVSFAASARDRPNRPPRRRRRCRPHSRATALLRR